jgi:ABC-type sugar transport system ATPase subunit
VTSPIRDDGAESGEGRAGAPPAVLSVRDVTKTYPGTRALKGLSMEVRGGELRALVGENGSGKSTFVGILGGKVVADPGSVVELDGRPLPQGDPAATRDLGIAVIHQELLMLPLLSAVENVFLGQQRTKGISIDRRRMRAEFVELRDRLGIDIAPDALAGSLSVAQQTMLEIMRAVRRDVRVLLLDEPSATLGVPEREALYAVIEGLRAAGVLSILVSHDLEEVLRLADSVTVLRDGSHVLTAQRADLDKNAIVGAMLGDARGEQASAVVRPEIPPRGVEVLSASNVRVGTKIDIEHISVAAGEIVGVAGLVGSGRSSLLRALAGVIPGSEGQLAVDGEPVPWPKHVGQALRHGIALLPEDRKHQGLVLGMTADDNIALADLRKSSNHGILRRSSTVATAERLLRDVEFRGRIREPVRNLSGGNQQKVLVAKWLHRGPRILLIDEPTRGIDIGAKQDIMRVIHQLAAEGHAIVWVSSELEEVVAASHRVLLMAKGRIVGELAGDAMTVAACLEGIFGATGSADDAPPPADALARSGATSS